MQKDLEEILNYTILKLGTIQLKVEVLLQFVLFWMLVFAALFIIRKAIYRFPKFDIAKKFAIFTLIKYFTIVIAIVISLQIIGFNLSVFLAGSAALLVGLGLGLQNLFADFISGIIILVDSSIKVKDIIEVNGLVAQVEEINLRTTTVLTRDDKYIILPNSDLTKNQLINWTHENISSRFEVFVGVSYNSNVEEVMQILLSCVENQKDILNTPQPFVRFMDFGDSSLNFGVFFWSNEVFKVENLKSNLRVTIFKALADHKIEIPFPQRVVHFKNKPEDIV